MKNKILRTVILIAIIIIFCIPEFGCRKLSVNEELIGKLPEKGTFSEEVYKEIKKVADITAADNVPETDGVIDWWDSYPRIASGNAKQLEKLHAEIDVTGSRNDEGRGAFARTVDSLSGIPALDLLHEAGYRGGSWMETQGTSTMFIMGLKQLEDGTFEQDPKTGAAKLQGWYWGWSSTGPEKNKNTNYLVWSGVHSFVNNEEWAYPYVISEYPEMSLPTYPDGTAATGYFEGGDITTPQLAVFYDSACAKDLFGNYFHVRNVEEGESTLDYAAVFTDKTNGKKVKTLYMNLGKDTADPFWLEYAKTTIDFWVSQGVDYFWCDNWNGWDAINNSPIYCAFGDWSEYRFKEYLKKHPSLGVKDTENFSITDYIIEKAKELDPNCIYTYIGDPVWSREEWRDDPIWRAYLCFKSEICLEYNTQIYRYVKEASLKYRGDENAVAVCGNDFPYMTFSAFDGDYLDIISTEYGSNYSAATGFYTSGKAPNRYSGHLFSLLADTVKSHNAIVWYYASEFEYTDNSGKMYAYEALAHNVVLHGAFSGTTNSVIDVNTTIEKLEDKFSDRRQYAGIGVVYSPDSETSYLIPSGFTRSDNPHDVSYMGWCSAFDELNIPYKSIQMDRLAERIDSVELLILPEICSISNDNIKLIKKFIKEGGTVIITGADSGKYDSMENCYEEREKAALTELSKGISFSKGKVIYMEEDPCFEYFKENKTCTFEEMYKLYLKDIEAKVKNWYKKGYVHEYLTLENVGPEASIITTLNYSYSEETFFIDIVNMQYDHDTDIMQEMGEVKLTARVPSMLWGKGYSVYLYTNGADDIIELEEGKDFTVYADKISLTVPSFENYATVIIK